MDGLGLGQAERCILFSAENPAALGRALVLLSSHPHLDNAIALPSLEISPWQGKPQTQAGHHNPSVASRSCPEGNVGREPCAHTAPRHPPASAV